MKCNFAFLPYAVCMAYAYIISEGNVNAPCTLQQNEQMNSVLRFFGLTYI